MIYNWEPRPGQTAEERSLTVRVLHRLAKGPPQRSDILSSLTIVKAWPQYRINGEEFAAPGEKQVHRWFSESPKDQNLWYLGQALNAADRPWCRSLCLLWTCGRLARCVQILAFLINDYDFDDDCIDSVWQLITHSENLYQEIPLDDTDTIAHHEYLTNEWPSIDGIEAAVQDQYRFSQPISVVELVRVYEYVNREVTKLFWKPCAGLVTQFNNAARRAFENEAFHSNFESVYIPECLDVAFRVANARDISLETRRKIVLIYLAEAFNHYECLPVSKPLRAVQDPIAANLFPELHQLRSLQQLEEDADKTIESYDFG